MNGPTATHDAQTSDCPPPRQLTPEEWQEILERHRAWLEAGADLDKRPDLSRTKLPPHFPLSGADLRKANLAGAHLQEADLRRARLEGAELQEAHLEQAILRDANLAHANLQGAHLNQAQLQGADLLETNFWRAKLEGVDLRDTTGLLMGQLAGTTLRRGTLPEYILTTEQRVSLEEISRSAQTLFFAMLGACIFALISIERISHDQLLSNIAALRVPFFEADIQIAWLYWLVPLFLLGIYVYFHLHLLPLWQGLAELPAVFPDGRPVHQSVYLWLLGAFLPAHVVPLSKNRSRLREVILIIFAWCLVPSTLFWFWLRYLPLHQWSATIWHIVLLLVAMLFGMGMYGSAAATLRREESSSVRKFLSRRALQDWRTYATAMALMIFGVVSFGAIGGVPPDRYILETHGRSRPRPPELYRIDPRKWVPIVLRFPAMLRFNCCHPFVDFGQGELSTRPATWTGRSQADMELVKGARLARKRLQYATGREAFLVKADFRAADLQGVDLTGADLRGARFEDDEVADLKGTNLKGANLQEVMLHWANLTRTPLQGADLTWAKLGGANLEGADLRNAKLVYADLSPADEKVTRLGWAKLQKADLTGADLTQADLSKAVLAEAKLQRANLTEAVLNEADLRKADLTGAILTGADLDGAQLQGAILLEVIGLTDEQRWLFRTDGAVVSPTGSEIAPPKAPQ